MKKPSGGRTPKTKKPTKKTGATSEVRIIGGRLKRRLVSFTDAVGLRPTPDRLRETLFNWLLADIHGAYVLDSCAGSGVLGFEALSRGAAHCTFIETNRLQSTLLHQNASQLHIDTNSHQIITGTAESVLTQPQIAPQTFDIVFIDPPYAKDLWQPILTALITHSWIDQQTLIYLEADKALDDQLAQLANTLHAHFAAHPQAAGNNIGFDCLKQTKVGQVVAGLYRLSSS